MKVAEDRVVEALTGANAGPETREKFRRMLRDGQLTFRALQEAAGTNPSVLNVRLKELREARILAHGPEGYGLTAHGKTLLAALLPLNAWADDWAKLLARPIGSPPGR